MTARCTIAWCCCAANAASWRCSSSAVPSSRSSRSRCRSRHGPTRGATIRPSRQRQFSTPSRRRWPSGHSTRRSTSIASSLTTALPSRCGGEQLRSRTTTADDGPRRSPCARSGAHSARSPGRSSGPMSSSSTTTSHSFRSLALRFRSMLPSRPTPNEPWCDSPSHRIPATRWRSWQTSHRPRATSSSRARPRASSTSRRRVSPTSPPASPVMAVRSIS